MMMMTMTMMINRFIGDFGFVSVEQLWNKASRLPLSLSVFIPWCIA